MKYIISDGEKFELLTNKKFISLIKNPMIKSMYDCFIKAFSIKVKKMEFYGDKKYYDSIRSTNVGMWISFSDVNKKFVRLLKLTEIVTTINNKYDEKFELKRLEAIRKLRDDYLDLINFSVDAVAIIERIALDNFKINLDEVKDDKINK
jgi:hypothetical protein